MMMVCGEDLSLPEKGPGVSRSCWRLGLQPRFCEVTVFLRALSCFAHVPHPRPLPICGSPVLPATRPCHPQMCYLCTSAFRH